MICEKCGIEHNGSFGSGRFCSRKCSNSRVHTEETKRKISESLKKIEHTEKVKNNTVKQEHIRKVILEGRKLAEDINLSNSPYSEYNTVFKYKLVGDRYCYELCLYEGNKRVKYETVLVHRFVVAQNIGRKLDPDEVVHHKDGNILNNDISNLQLMSRSDHSRYHALDSNISERIAYHGGWNKGMKMSEEFKKHCREGANKRHNK